MLGGDDHRFYPRGFALVVLHGHLALAVGPQVGQDALFPDVGQLPGQAVRQGDGQRHKFRGIVAGIAHHHALVAGADGVQRVGGASPGLDRFADA